MQFLIAVRHLDFKLEELGRGAPRLQKPLRESQGAQKSA